MHQGVAEAGVEDKVSVIFCDYRDVAAGALSGGSVKPTAFAFAWTVKSYPGCTAPVSDWYDAPLGLGFRELRWIGLFCESHKVLWALVS